MLRALNCSCVPRPTCKPPQPGLPALGIPGEEGPQTRSVQSAVPDGVPMAGRPHRRPCSPDTFLYN